MTVKLFGCELRKKLFAQVNCNWNEEERNWLVVPVKISALTTIDTLHCTRILERELNERALDFTHFELINIFINERKFPKLG